MRDVSNLRIGEPYFTSQVIFIGSIFMNFLAIRIVILSLIVCKISNLFLFSSRFNIESIKGRRPEFKHSMLFFLFYIFYISVNTKVKRLCELA